MKFIQNGHFLDTVKSFLAKNKLGKYNEEEMKRKEEQKKREEEAEEAQARLCKVGDRCEILVSNQPRRRATIMYVGKYSIVPPTCTRINLRFLQQICES